MSVTKYEKFIDGLKSISKTIKEDKNWKYNASTTGYTFESARKGKRTGNCAHFVCWGLRFAGFPDKGFIYLKDGEIHYQGSTDAVKEMKKYVEKNIKVIKTHNNKKLNIGLSSSLLEAGDIIGFKGLVHTCVFMSYDKTKKKATMYDGGSYANENGYKRNCHLKKSTYGHNINIILRFKNKPEKVEKVEVKTTTTTTKKQTTTSASTSTTTKKTTSSTFKVKVINEGGANIRKEPGVKSEICTSTELKNGLKYGETVTVVGTGEASSGTKLWYLIEKNGKRGYVSSKLVKKV